MLARAGDLRRARLSSKRAPRIVGSSQARSFHIICKVNSRARSEQRKNIARQLAVAPQTQNEALRFRRACLARRRRRRTRATPRHEKLAAAATAFAPLAALAGGQAEGTGLALGIEDFARAVNMGGFMFAVFFRWSVPTRQRRRVRRAPPGLCK